ncbi:HAD-like domain-containing protein [Mycotypha africana]|uniref:HAD-like domain-containing protein n=1 Tax=Mycotypha africana TaxID=64632 RepID=UPI002301E864|nr:HAD-like domain-containing protein [Mycotypha africana]KAI8967260.1 HAD-like domain-containing protein [Mycotypha africana]
MVSKTLACTGIIFDLDGTLIDTTPLVIQAWTDIAKKYNLDPEQILATSHGRRTIETLQRWVPEIATVEYVNQFEAELAQNMEGVMILPGVRELVGSIDVQDWTVNTAGTWTMATTRLTQFNLPVPKDMATGDRLTHGKPHPEGYLRAAEIIGKEPRQCIVFEDAPAGVQAAVAAGMQCIACLTTHTAQQLKEAGATVIVERLDSVHVKKQADGTYQMTVDKVVE